MKMAFQIVGTALGLVAAPSANDQWNVSTQKDRITDRVEVQATLQGDNAKFILMCSPGAPMILVYQPTTFLGGGGSRYELRDFIYRFDDQPAARESWKYNDDYAAAYSDKAARAFLHQMVSAHKVVVRAERYDHATIDTTFAATNSATALAQAFGDCGWKAP